MREIGVRELKASLSEMLRAAGRGERVRVTSHGRPIADIVAPDATASEDALQELVTAGRLTPPARPRPRRAPPLVEGARSASSVVLDERDAER
jgi:prevent-host-death family protein